MCFKGVAYCFRKPFLCVAMQQTSFFFLVLLFLGLCSACSQDSLSHSSPDDQALLSPDSGSDTSSHPTTFESRSQNLQNARFFNDSAALLSTLFSMGNAYYEQGLADSALIYWQEALSLSQAMHKTPYTKALLTNLGAAFMDKGFNNVASSFFVKADSLFVLEADSSMNFWINRINMGVAWMDQNKPDRARKAFESIAPADSLTELKFLQFSNLSNLAFLQNDSSRFFALLDSAQQLIDLVPHYSHSFLSLALANTIELHSVPKLKTFLKAFSGRPNEAPLFLRILLNYAHLKAYGTFAEPLLELQKLPLQPDWEDNLRANEAYFYMMAYYFESLGLYQKQVQNLKQAYAITDSIQIFQNNTLLNEYEYLLLAQTEMVIENEQLKNTALKQTQKINNQRIMVVVGVLGMLMLAVILFLTDRNFKKNRDLNEAQIALSLKELEREKENKVWLQQKLWAKDQKLKQTLQSMRKIALLKTQFDSFLDTLSGPQYRDLIKDVKKARINMNSFFSNYQDLAFYANLNQVTLDKVEQLQKQYSQLTKREVQVLALLLNDFKTAEVSMLLKRTEKQIENIRVSIRKKLNIPSAVSIQEFVNPDSPE